LGGGTVGAQGSGKELGLLGTAAGAPERADSQVKKNRDHAGRDPEGSVIAGVPVGDCGSPERRGENDRRKQKEDPGDFEPEDSAHAAEGAQKAADAAAHGSPGLGCGAGSGLNGGRASDTGHGYGHRMAGLRCPRRLRSAGNGLAGNPSYHADSDAESPADGSRSHSVYDGSSGPRRFALGYVLPGLLLHRIGSKVERFHAAARMAPRCGLPLPEVSVTSRLRELIQQLGEAIHESVIESEQIAGVVQDIRKHGFDVLLMLEATIGLNEVTAAQNKKGEAGEIAAEAGAEPGTFTQNDLHFLRSLRISIEGDKDEAESDVK
jgi:hypothetical protein